MDFVQHNELVVAKMQQKEEYAGKLFAPSYLLVTQEIDNSKSRYKFDLKENGNENAIERKLDRNDTFIVTGIQYFLLAVVSSEWGKAEPQYYPNKTTFPAVTAGSTFDPDDLQVFWNGYLSLKIGPTVITEALDTRRAYKANSTQKSSSSNFNEHNGHLDGLIPVVPQWVINGNDNSELTLDIPVFANINVDNTNSNTNNYVCVKPIGYLVKEAQ